MPDTEDIQSRKAKMFLIPELSKELRDTTNKAKDFIK